MNAADPKPVSDAPLPAAEAAKVAEPNPVIDALKTPEPGAKSFSPTATVIGGWVALLVAGALFFVIAWNVSGHSALVDVDARVSAWLHLRAMPMITDFMLGVSLLHAPAAMAGWGLAFAAILYRVHERYWIMTLLLAMAGGSLLNLVLKYSYARTRPHFEDPFVTLSSYSFPSGHTAGAVLFYGVLGAFLVSRFKSPARRTAIVAGALGMVALVAFSRVYLGAHYLSDVMAAACSSIAWLALCLSSVHQLVRARKKESPR